MEIFMIILKALLLAVGCVYGFSNIGKLMRSQEIYGSQIWLMVIGIIGFVTIHFWIGY